MKGTTRWRVVLVVRLSGWFFQGRVELLLEVVALIWRGACVGGSAKSVVAFFQHARCFVPIFAVHSPSNPSFRNNCLVSHSLAESGSESFANRRRRELDFERHLVLSLLKASSKMYTQNDLEKARNWKGMGLVIVGFGVLTALGLYFALASSKVKHEEAMSWPTVEGKVVKSTIKKKKKLSRLG